MNRIFLLALLALVAVALFNPAGIILATIVLGLVAVALTAPSPDLRVTLTVPELLNQVLPAFVTEFPALNRISKDVSTDTAVKGMTILSHVSTLPSTSDFDTSWSTGAADADSLLTDLPVVLDTLKICPIKVPWLTQLGSKVDLSPELIRNSGYVLGKYLIDQMLAKATAANFSQSANNVQPGNVDLGLLENIRSICNQQKMAQSGRVGVVSTAFAESLAADPKASSKLFYNELTAGDSSIRQWQDICGFSNIWEYPDLPDNGEGLNAFFWESRAFHFCQRSIRFSNVAKEMGITQTMTSWSTKEVTSGLVLDAVGWQEPGTANVFTALALLFGLVAGSNGGSPGTLGDLAGLRCHP